MIKFPVFKKRNIQIYTKTFFVSLSAENNVSKLKWESNLQNFIRHPYVNVNKSLMGVWIQFTVSFENIYRY